MTEMRKPGSSVSGLAELVRSVDGSGLVGVEVGVFAGAGTSVMLGTGKFRRIYCIDPWKAGYDPTDVASDPSELKEAEETFDATVAGFPQVVKMKGTLQSEAQHVREKVDFVYIDANHTKDAVLSDIRTAMTLRPAVISGHDYVPGWPGVMEAVDEAFGKPDRTFCDGSWAVYDPESRIKNRKEKGMKVLYLLGTGSKHDNMELRWSLRSLDMYARNVDEVIVLGETPEWLNGDTVRAVPFKESGTIKHDNMAEKVLYAIDSGLVTEEFLLSSDDHVLLKEADFSAYPYYIRGMLKSEHEYACPINKYRRSLIDTKKILEEYGYPTYCFHGHVNTHIDPKYVENVRRMLKTEPKARYGYEITELFMNVKADYDDISATARPDVKLRTFTGEADFEERLKGYDCFSFSDSVFETKQADNLFVPSGFEAFMNGRYPGPCKYERS